jgi:hypothetical protein
MYLALELSEKGKWHPPVRFLSISDALEKNPRTHLPAESSAITRYVNPPSEM